ncbi:hypothetical protein OIE66_22740 [Nonomuraea sp. NBC_01738]|uniref:hypothetical protein n=1 Tax=Nonomuraea sp. NBC_01738 TaxID=2976003 RepID=UPI002E167B12|nr:hypothetical protein OIE66_22740 [Nonomuraea sp. NBC_01738]
MRIASSHHELVAMFDWARERASRWQHAGGTVGPVDVDERQPSGTGTGVYLPSYWAGYAHRSGFYARDFAHQLVGAHLLGMTEANLTMLRCFAASATPEHGYVPVWAFNFDGSYLSIDYHGPDRFVRELPAAFELVEKAEVAYRWTGDRAYLDDPVLRAFRVRAAELPARATGRSIFEGVASYNELEGEHLAEAGDAIAAQYRALLAMGYTERASALRRHFNDTWSVGPGPMDVVRGYTVDGDPVTGWGGENSWFIPLKDLLDPGPRLEGYLDFIDERASGVANVEALTYLPDLFFLHDRDETAWRWMRHIFGRRGTPHVAGGLDGDYPEVSFTLVSQVVEGLLGLRPDAPAGAVTTRSHLPGDIGWAEVSGIPVGNGTITVRHDGPDRSTLTNTGATPVRWEARFAGERSTVSLVEPGQRRTVHRE